MKSFDLFNMKSAKFSPCRKYRYELWRWWDKSKGFVLFIGLNPSTADETSDDPTIRRCINFVKDWGFGGLCMANLFAYRATEPKQMMISDEPIGPDNDITLKNLALKADMIVAAWGGNGVFNDRDKEVLSMIKRMLCLGKTKNGHPRHPLYVKRDTELIVL